ncbi:MAG: TadG family pilus assembly protein [Brevundimonas sp.]|uniref:TadG family pilus assembly protein n=1 Tax=Brevundimonas sp. TaxID=1871086 RepID=UPI00391CDA5C
MWSDRRGGVSIMGCVAAALACGLAALTIDVGSVALHARTVQTAADLGALAAARDLERAEEAGLATVTDNLGMGAETVVERGFYAPDPTVTPEARFSAGGAGVNAARVTVRSEAPLYFGRWVLGRPSTPVTRTARAARRADEPLAAFSLGSRLARLDGGVANQILSGLTGSSLSLTAADYQALVDAQVDLLGFSRALATEANVSAGRFDRLADARIDGPALTRALAQALATSDTARATPALSRVGAAAEGRSLRVGDLVDLSGQGVGAGLERLDARASALDALFAGLETANGERQLSLDLGARTGLADLDVWLAIGERPNQSPWLAVTADGEPVLSTAQARLFIRARTAQSLAGLARVDLPILIELAPAQARLQALRCTPSRSVDLAVRPGVARARVTAVDTRRLADFKTPIPTQKATLLSVAGLVSVAAQADVEAADPGFRTVGFSADDIAARRTRSASSRGFAGGLVATLIQRLDVDVRVIGLGLGLGNLTQALGVLLTPLGPVLDGVVNAVLDPLGLKFGEAHVTVHGLRCPDAAGGAASAVLVG